jgi:alkyl hydroperoxide reductase subunit D
MKNIEAIQDLIPEAAKDIRVNLKNVLAESTLSVEQRWGVAVASAIAARNEKLRDAILADARESANEAVIDDAKAAAALMAMNNVFYRFRHVIEKESYSTKPARLRMTRIAKPATNKLDFELYSLAVSSINNCEACIKAHEKVSLEGGLSEDQILDAIRIAAVIHAAAVSLELG